MYYILVFLGLFVVGYFVIKIIKYKSLYPFMPYRYNFGKRRITFSKTIELLDKTKAKVLVETGTSRQGLRAAKGDGAATIVFGKWAKLKEAFLHSVDISEQSIKEAQAEVDLQGLSEHVKIYLSDSIAFLEKFDQQVDFLYLDSYDYSDDLEVQQKSQLHHLNEFKAIEHKLHEKSIVLIDDCALPNGGKGKTTVEYMLQNNWKILLDEYQILLVRGNFTV